MHGELLKLGYEVAQSTVAKYMIRRRGRPGQDWRTFLCNHAPDAAAIDLFVVPTLGFKLLYALVIAGLGRRELVWVNVTAHPTAEWIAHQVTEAFPWEEAPTYLIRDNDALYGSAFIRRLRAMGIRDRPITPGSPWQNGAVERLIGSIRRECLDQFSSSERRICGIFFANTEAIITKSGHTAQLTKTRPFLGLYSGPAQSFLVRSLVACIINTLGFRFSVHTGKMVSRSILGGLHHQYVRV
jgi:transposase InsO family protein